MPEWNAAVVDGGGGPNKSARGEDARWRRESFERDGRSSERVWSRTIYGRVEGSVITFWLRTLMQILRWFLRRGA